MPNALPASAIRRTSALPRLALCALAGGLALATAGCNTPSVPGLAAVTNRVDPPPADEGRLRAYVAEMEPRYTSHPNDKAVAIAYATALRRLTQHAQAVAVLQKLAVKYPQDMTVLANYGKALADAGRLQEAQSVLEHAHTPEHPNWTVLSAQGSVADQMGDHKRAQAYYATALKIVPNQPQVLSNLGLSYALEKQMPLAERTLRDAAAQPSADERVRQNLAMVLSMEGKYADAEEVTRRDLSPIDAAETVHSMKQEVAQTDTWVPKSSSRQTAAKSRPATDQTAAVY